MLDRLARDLVEDHPPHRDLRLEHLHQVPGDRLALPILIGCQQQFIGASEQALQLGDPGALGRIDDVQRSEVASDVHTEVGPRQGLHLRGHLRSPARQVPDMANTRLDLELRAEVALDRLGLGRAFDDDESGHPVGAGAASSSADTTMLRRLDTHTEATTTATASRAMA